jgi:DNA-binding winged helix-turn-helix (wHTH) protein
LDERTRELRDGDQVVAIEPKVFDFLAHLIRHRDRLVTKDELFDVLWADINVNEAALARLAKEARRVVGDDGKEQHTIETRRGHGYRFVAKVEQRARQVQSTRPAPAAAGFGGLAERVSCPPDQSTAVSRGRRLEDLALAWVFPVRSASQWPATGRLRVGRGQSCEERLDGAEVSREHAELFRDGPLCIIKDLGSRNGTHVNGERITQRAVLPGDVIRCGDWVGVVVEQDGHASGLQELAANLWGGPVLAAALDGARRAVESVLPVVVIGPPGTPRQALARAMHEWDERPGEFLVARCAGMSPEQARAMLVGTASTQGLVERARGGTLFVDDALELDGGTQAALALAFETGTPAGRENCQTQLVVAMMESPATAVAAGRLHAVFGALLQGPVIALPPLSARRADIPALFARALHGAYAGTPPLVSARVVERLCLYDWHLNDEELCGVARHIRFSVGPGTTIDVTHLPPSMSSRNETGHGRER